MHAKSIGTYEIGFETNGTPYVRVPTYFEDGSVEGFIQSLEELVGKVESYRNDTSKVEETFQQRADRELKSLYRNDRSAYETIVKDGKKPPNIDGSNIMLLLLNIKAKAIRMKMEISLLFNPLPIFS